MQTLSIRFTHWDAQSVWAEMPVNSTVFQPYGLLHGGATVALAETVGSVLSATTVDREAYRVLGLQINSTHFKSVRKGTITAKAEFIKKTASHHWVKVEVYDEQQNLVHISQLTNALKAIAQ